MSGSINNPYKADCLLIEKNLGPNAVHTIGTWKRFCKENGYVISEINFADPKNSSQYNPLLYCRNEKEIIELVEGINRYICELRQNNTITSSLFKAVCLLLAETCKKEAHNFASALYFLLLYSYETDKESPLDLIFSKLEKTNPKSTAVYYYKIFKIYPEEVQRESIAAYLDSLSFLSIPGFKNVMVQDSLALNQLFTGSKIAIFVTNEEVNPQYKLITDTLIAQCEHLTNKYGKSFVHLSPKNT